ncbi:FAD-binding oxidoreductase, partial [Candidatus Thorarchaeota archaeon]
MTNRIVALKPDDIDISQVKTVTDQAEIADTYALYLDDESHSFDGIVEKIVFPSTEAEVAGIMKLAFDSGNAITIQGGRTGLTGAAVPLGGIAMNLEKMNDLLYMDYAEPEELYSIAADAGVTLEDLVKAVITKNLNELKNKGTEKQQAALSKFLGESDTFTFPVDPTEMSAWLGGIVACNASGAKTYKYGAVREWVRRIRVVLANGDILDITRGDVVSDEGKFVITMSNGTDAEVKVPSYTMPQTKNAAGLYAKSDMDLIDLFVGSEGILGVI